MKKRILSVLLTAVFLFAFNLEDSQAQTFTHEGDESGSVCVTGNIAKYHCVASGDGSGDICSKTAQVGPACSNTARPN